MLIELGAHLPFFGKYFELFVSEKVKKVTGLRWLLLLVWIISAVALITNWFRPFFCLVLYCIYRFFYLSKASRFKFKYGLAAYLFYLLFHYTLIFEICSNFLDIKDGLVYLLLAFRIQIGLILLSGGINKITGGFISSKGTKFALTNPSWCKLHFLFKKISFKNPLFRAFNYLTLFIEILTGFLLLIPIPKFQLIGGFLLMLIFSFSMLNFRVNIISLLMIAVSYVLMASYPVIKSVKLGIPDVFGDLVVAIILGIYITFIISIFVVSHLNYFRKKEHKTWFNSAFAFFSKLHPMYVFNIFTYERINFYVSIYLLEKTSKRTAKVVYDGFSKQYFNDNFSFLDFFRYSKGIESCGLMGLFYSGSNQVIGNKEFNKNLINYAKTVCPDKDRGSHYVLFKVVKLEKGITYIQHTPMMNYVVDSSTNQVMAFSE